MGGLRIEGLAALRARLAAVQVEEVMGRALAAQAEAMAETVRDGLGEAPGIGAHERPWERSGALRASVRAVSQGLEAAVGSSDPAAAPQEMGTVRMVARPFLAPVAAGMGGAVARAVGSAVAAALTEGEGTDAADVFHAGRMGDTLIQSESLATVHLATFLGLSSDRSLAGPALPVADRTTNHRYAAKRLGLSENEFGDAVHSLKEALGIDGSVDLSFSSKGDVYDGDQHIGNLFDELK